MSVLVNHNALVSLQGYRVDCTSKATAPTEAEPLKKIAVHAKSVHSIDPVPPD